MIYMIGTADQYVVIDKMLAIGADTSAVGIKWAVQSFMEVPLFLFASAILKRVKPGMLLLFGTVMYGLKFFLYGVFSVAWACLLYTSWNTPWSCFMKSKAVCSRYELESLMLWGTKVVPRK